MRRFLMSVAVLTVAWAGSLGYAQTMRISNIDDYKKAMQAIGAAFGGANKAAQSGDVAGAKTQVATIKANMMAVQVFFKDKAKSDAEMLAKVSYDKLDAFEKALGGADQAAAFKEAGGTCATCHAKYRDQDPTTKAYSFKPGTI